MDKELDSLLDDALADFDKPVASSSTSASSSSIVKDKKSASQPKKSPLIPPPVEIFNNFFDGAISEKLQEEWNLAMQELSEEDPELQKHIELMSNVAEASNSKGTKNSQDSEQTKEKNNPDEVGAKVKQAIESLAKCTEEEGPSDEIFKSFMNFGLNEGDDEDGLPGLGMMEDMMKMMLSKDMLYPPMLDMKKNFPAWIEKNRENLSDTDMKNYEKQLLCIEKICNEFESEAVSDSDSIKTTRFNTIMNTVHEMQKYGQPPPSLVGDQNFLPQENCVIS